MRIALKQFLVRIKSIERIIALRGSLVEFGRARPENLNPTATNLRRSVRRIGQSGMQPILDGCVLLLSATFEQFVLDVMVAFAGNLPDIIPAYSSLPNAIRSANEIQTGEALSDRRSRFSEYDLQSFVRNLSPNPPKEGVGSAS